MRNVKNQKGYSLVEATIAVTILGILASLLIPNLLTSRRAANMAAAVSTLRAINSAQAMYQSTYGNGSFTSLSVLGNRGMVDRLVATPPNRKSGYRFTSNAVGTGAPARFDATARPLVRNGQLATGTRNYYTNESGVIYFNNSLITSSPPTANATTRVVFNGAALK